jgi:hypothetical protein
LRGDWANAYRSDLALIRKALKAGWPVKPELLRPLVEAALAPLHREDTPERMVLAIAQLVLAADRYNLETELAEAKVKALPKPTRPVDDARPAAPWPPPVPGPVGMPDAEEGPSRSPEPAPALPEPADRSGGPGAPPDAPAPPEGPGPV